MRKKQNYTNNIGKILDEQGVKNSWFAYKMDVTHNTVLNWRNNKTQPDRFRLAAMAKLLNVELKILINEQDKKRG